MMDWLFDTRNKKLQYAAFEKSLSKAGHYLSIVLDCEEDLRGLSTTGSERRRLIAVRCLASKKLEFYNAQSSELCDLYLGWASKNDSNDHQLFKPPGFLLERSAKFVFSKRSWDNIFCPIITDMREEYFEALSQKSIPKARWVHVRGTWSFFKAIGQDRAFAFVSFFIKAWKSVN